MLRRIRIKSLEDIALGLIQRDNETKKDYYNYHDTVKELGFEIKSNIIQNLTKKEDFKIITAFKKEFKTQDEINKSLKTTKTMNSTNNANNSNTKQKMSTKRLSCNKKNCKEINCGIKKDNIENNLKEKHSEDNFVLKTKKLLYNEQLFFHLDYNNINAIISNCYFPLLQCFQSYDNFKLMLFDIADKLEIYFNNDSFFSLNQKSPEEIEEFIEEEKILELIEFSLIIFLLQYFIKNNNNNFINNSLNNNTTKDNTNDNNISNSEEEIIQIFQECYLVLQKIYENLILQLLFNENFNKAKKSEDKNEICEKYINEFFIFTQKPKSNEQIINKINENIYLIIKGLFKSIKLILEYLKLSGIKFDEANKQDPQLINFEINETEEVFSDSIKNLDNINELNTIVNLCNFYIDQKSDIFQKFIEKVNLDQYKCFNSINSYFNLIINKSKIKSNKNNNTKKIPNKIVKKPLVISPSLYKKIQICVYVYYDNFKIILEKHKIKIPFLPPMDTNKYKYTLVLDLDETLVHYIEEKDRHYVQVRPFAEYFISEMGKYFELVIFTSAEEEYANIVLEEIDKYKVITHKLYRRHVEYNDGLCLKDLDKIGRDIKRVCIIDNDKNNFKLHVENGIEIKEFLGEQDDNELDLLGDLLMSIIESNADDIRPIIKDIKNKMNKINEEKNNIEK
jgi:Dullard-like phosphatase family protein